MEPKQTQGQQKLLRYLSDLIRNKQFLLLLKRLGRYEKRPKGNCYDWSEKEKKRHDEINTQAGPIIKDFLSLKKRANKLVRDRAFAIKETIAGKYGLDSAMIYLTQSMREKDDTGVKFSLSMYDHDMCTIVNTNEETLHPFNDGEDFIYIGPGEQLRNIAFPVSIAVNSRASKRDVMDFIEKRWPWIEARLRNDPDDKVLKNKERKHSQELLDFLWQNQSITPKKLKEKLDAKFPRNGLVYYEITKLIHLERQKRLGS